MRVVAAVITLLLAGCAGFTPTATDPEGVMREVATILGKDRCMSQSLQWGDRNGDRQLSQAEFEDLTLISLHATIRSHKAQLEDLNRRQSAVDASGERRRELEAKLAGAESEVEPGRRWAQARFVAFDTDRSGILSAGELADACAALGAP
jgi:hypothetical protein